MDLQTGIFLTQVATLIVIVSFGAKILRFVNRIEFKVDLMWEDYEARMAQYRQWKQNRPSDETN